MSDTTDNKPAEPTQISIEIQKFYVKEQSCKAPQAILPEGKPENNLELRLNSQQVKQDVFEVTLTHPENKPAHHVNDRGATSGFIQARQDRRKSPHVFAECVLPELALPICE